MKFITSTAIALAAGLVAAPAAAQMGYTPTPSAPPPTAAQSPGATQAAQGVQIKLSSKAQKAILDLQTAVKANDVANIPAKIAAAQAVAQTKDDRYAIGKLQLDAASAANDSAAAAAAVDTIASSGFLDTPKIAGLYKQIGVVAFNGKQYTQAATLFQKSVALSPTDVETVKFLGLAQNAAGQKAEASATLARALQLSAAGQKPAEDLYKQAIGIAYGAKSPAAIDLGRQWVAAYPSPSSWHDALVIYRNLGGADVSQALDIMRLARATDAMQNTGDYNLYASETINSMNYGEAKAVMAEGLASGKIKAADPVVQDIENALKGKAAPTPAELATREAAAKVPAAYLRVGDAYYGAGNYQKAAELYRNAFEKGADANLANLRLGEALARAGDKAGATAALNKVGGSLTGIAKFWLTYAQRS